jgi:selenide,water dikinase
MLFDPQTSGGLLLVVSAAQADDLIASLKNDGIETAVRVGEVVAADRPFIRVV